MTETFKLEMTRVFKAEPGRVYEAWTSADRLKRWLLPHDSFKAEAKVDAKPGGEFRMDMAGRIGNDDVSGYATGEYREVVPGEKLVFTWNWHNKLANEVMPETLIAVTFASKDGGTELSLVHDRFITPGLRDEYTSGWLNCFKNLDALLG
ncbi:SRPBCC family protein [Fundidesulfovibrio soli]|uniref:SRPBCC family protein n=1 Tax=Fundidesulfovibrio soli TaxID=2922716 RepID=UPI001FAF878D|nr:SRPBCC domain-containing protein [Fundidesulfovibrio soli]